MFRTAEGLTITYLSGAYNAASFPSAGGAPTDLRVYYSRGDVGKLCDMGKVWAVLVGCVGYVWKRITLFHRTCNIVVIGVAKSRPFYFF